jgi:hypothetical protein
MPGDDMVADPHFRATRAITIDAAPEEVWPWLVQVGFGRAGFYSYDLLDRLGRPSARTIHPEWQRVALNDVAAPMTSTPTASTSFRVALLQAPHELVWAKPNSSWSWRLTPLRGGRTRLVTRLQQRYRPDASSLLTVPLLEFGDFPMMRHMLLGIKQRAEAGTGALLHHVASLDGREAGGSGDQCPGDECCEGSQQAHVGADPGDDGVERRRDPGGGLAEHLNGERRDHEEHQDDGCDSAAGVADDGRETGT